MLQLIFNIKFKNFFVVFDKTYFLVYNMDIIKLMKGNKYGEENFLEI